MTLHPQAANRSVRENLHAHDYVELMYMYRGDATQYFEDGVVPLKEGSVCLLNRTIRHQIQLDQEDAVLIYVMIRPEVIERSFANLLHDNEVFYSFLFDSIFGKQAKGEYILFDSAEDTSVRRIMESVIVEYVRKQACYTSVIQSQLICLFAEAVRNSVLHWEKTEDEHLVYLRMIKYVQENIRDVTLGQMAENFHYHPNTVTRILKKYAGESFSILVQDIRMQKACALLRDTQIPVPVIVEDRNYYDQSCFGKVFRKKFHTTPGNYRRLCQKPGA